MTEIITVTSAARPIVRTARRVGLSTEFSSFDRSLYIIADARLVAAATCAIQRPTQPAAASHVNATKISNSASASMESAIATIPTAVQNDVRMHLEQRPNFEPRKLWMCIVAPNWQCTCNVPKRDQMICSLSDPMRRGKFIHCAYVGLYMDRTGGIFEGDAIGNLDEQGMTGINHTITVALYLRGAELDPGEVSEALGRQPDRSQYKGQRQLGAAGRQYVRNIGLWAIEARPERESSKLADHIDAILSNIDFDREAISKLRGLEEAYLDVFVATDPENGGGGTCVFEINPSQMARLSRIGVPVRVTVAVIGTRQDPL